MFVENRARPVHKVDNLTVISEAIVQTVLSPQHITSLKVSTACYGYSFNFLYVYFVRTLQETHL
jgi:hypothetical protein